jgi:uncharacterized membrane protein required for colicin V production
MIGDLVGLYFAKFKYMAIIVILVAVFGGYLSLKSRIAYLESRNVELQRQLDTCLSNQKNCDDSNEFLQQAIKNITEYCHKPIETHEGALTPDELKLWDKRPSK